jgi:hypothetical protein
MCFVCIDKIVCLLYAIEEQREKCIRHLISAKKRDSATTRSHVFFLLFDKNHVESNGNVDGRRPQFVV